MGRSNEGKEQAPGIRQVDPGQRMPREKTFKASAVTLNYLDYGSSLAEPMVMLHGGAWRWQEYLSLIPSLGRRWHTYALDLRGNGRSGWTPETYRLQDFAQDNMEFVSGLKTPAILVGHSIGGVVALMIASRHPDKMKALIIEDVPVTLDNYRGFIESSRDMFNRWLALKEKARSEQELSFMLAVEYGDYPGATSTWIMFFAGCLWQMDPTFFKSLLYDFDGFIEGYDCKQILERIDCPVLFLRGETKLGAVMTDDEISWLQKNFSNVECIQIESVGHLLHLESHGQTAVLAGMTAFLDRIYTDTPMK